MFSNLVPGNISRPILTYLNQFSTNAKGLTAAGLIGLVVTSVMTMLTVENALNAIWRVRQRRPLAQRVLVFWALVTFGPVLIGASLSVSSYMVSISAGYVHKLPFGLGVIVGVVPILLSAIAFAMLYVFVPNTYVARRDAFLAGLIAAVAFEVAKRIFGSYVAHIPTYTAVYGAFATLPIFLTWIYVSWLVTLLGATIASTLPIIRQGYWQRRTFPGSEFFDALGVLLLLYRAREQAPRTVAELEIGRRLQLEAEYLADLLAKAGDGDFLRTVAEAVVQLIMETDVEGLIGAGRHERTGERSQSTGITWEYHDGEECRDVHFKGVFDDKGRMMVFIAHNTDNGDGWEREGENAYFFSEFSEKRAFPLGINVIFYAMTH